MSDGDPRVSIFIGDFRKDIHISHLVWMSNTESIIPTDFEIHHKDEDPHNNEWENLLCLHKFDHRKFHQPLEDDFPF